MCTNSSYKLEIKYFVLNTERFLIINYKPRFVRHFCQMHNMYIVLLYIKSLI